MLICCLGDSLTEGDYGVPGKQGIANVQPENYPYFLSKLTGAEVRNFGRCGYRATDYLEYYKTGAVDVRDADVILIMLGTNGGHDPHGTSAANEAYEELIRCCRRDAGKAEIILCTPPHATVNPQMSNYGAAPQVKDATAFVRILAEREGLRLIDVARCPDFTAETEAVMQPNDGLHFGRLGYETMAKFIFRHL